MITLSNVSKEYKNGDEIFYALNSLNLVVENQEFLAIMGISGSGKTTLLNILGGMDRMTNGEYKYNNIDVGKMNRKELVNFRRNHVGFVFQNFALLNEYTVYENVELPLLSLGLKRKERDEKIKTALTLIGIEDLSEKFPSNLSGGQQQRCAIARAIVAGNDIILADEPTGALDSKTSEHIMNVFAKLHEAGKTVIVVTHDDRMAEFAERIVYISDGKIYEKAGERT